MRYVLAVLVGLVIAAGIAVGWMFNTVNHAAGTDATPVSVTIESGQQLRSVANLLQSKQLIRSASAWTLYALSLGQRSAILADTFTLNQTMTGREILKTLTTNPLKDNEVTVTIKEGWTMTQIADELEKKNVVNAQEFLNLVQHPVSAGFDASAFRIASQKPSTVDFEGYLFPDTYRFFINSTPEKVLQRFLANLDVKFTADLEQQAKVVGHSPHQILTMASILEREGKDEQDWKMIADIFWSRINLGIPMQSDATVNYATGKMDQVTTSIADTQVNSPYNTYKNKGLPPGPIDNPGLQTIQAAISPTTNDYLYFLTAPDGTTYYAKTLAEHNANKAKYLK